MDIKIVFLFLAIFFTNVSCVQPPGNRRDHPAPGGHIPNAVPQGGLADPQHQQHINVDSSRVRPNVQVAQGVNPHAQIQPRPVGGNVVGNQNLAQNNPNLQQGIQNVAQHVQHNIKQVVPEGKPRSRNAFGSIAQSTECAPDVQRICNGKNPNNNFDILYCLTNNQDNYEISDDCHHYIWNFKLNTTKDPKFHIIAREVCKQPLKVLSECAEYKDTDGKLIPCLLDNKATITAPGCKNFLTKIQTIMFSDYRLICDFVNDCKDDIARLTCGKIGDTLQPDEEMIHSQSDVVDCLETEYENEGTLTPQCRKQISRLAELSADDYHLDRHLYFKCKGDRETLCPDVVAGQGMVYKCLFKHKFDNKMTHECRDALTSRQKLVAEDYKASYGLAHHCKVEIEKNKCGAKGKAANDHITLASIMLCLENQNLNGVPISAACDDELVEFRRMIMDDYELSPEIVHGCSKEISKDCHGGLEKESKTLHCLLGLAQKDNGLNKQCQDALMDLIKETEVAQDYRMDAVLTRSCEGVIQAKCNDLQSGDPMVLSCLMDNLHSKQMNKKCKERLLELQYFISRDFLIDPTFRDQCKDDAFKFCKAPLAQGAMGGGEGDDNADDDNEVEPVPFSMVMSCLYRHMHAALDDEEKAMVDGGLSDGCEKEVHRIIKQRALDVNLNPELEKNCRQELGQHCSEQIHEKGTEFSCLQDNFDNLKPGKCRDEIKKLTQMESQNAEDFDSILVRECEPMLQKYCSDLLDQEDEGKIMECLISHKEEMESNACAAGVAHFQLIEMKDYTFSYKFLKACKKDVKKHCSSEGIKTKADVVRCLSLNVRNAVIGGTDSSLSVQCVDQLTVENLEMHKNIQLNPELKNKCSMDQQKYCEHVKTGKAQVIECLRKHKHKLSPKCYKALFAFEEEEVENPNLDFQLMRSCKSDIKEHCRDTLANGDTQLVVECLIKKKKDLIKSCRLVVIEREKEMFSDIELNPDLMNSCGDDIKRLCGDATAKAKVAHEKGEDPEGIVYKCLKKKFISKSKKDALSMVCYRHVEFVMVEQEQNYALDPQLTLHCYKSIQTLCPPKGNQNVVECLKNKYFDNALSSDPQCMVEVARMLAEGQSDIMADPALHQACSNDLTKYCHLVSEGHGRLITCLVDVAKKDKTSLSSECAEELELRTKMWKNAIQKNVNDVAELSDIVMSSEHSTYLLSMLTMIIVFVLLLGTVCGRLTKRVTKDRKTR